MLWGLWGGLGRVLLWLQLATGVPSLWGHAELVTLLLVADRPLGLTRDVGSALISEGLELMILRSSSQNDSVIWVLLSSRRWQQHWRPV